MDLSRQINALLLSTARLTLEIAEYGTSIPQLRRLRAVIAMHEDQIDFATKTIDDAIATLLLTDKE